MLLLLVLLVMMVAPRAASAQFQEAVYLNGGRHPA
jgi:hypothetical protein